MTALHVFMRCRCLHALGHFINFVRLLGVVWQHLDLSLYSADRLTTCVHVRLHADKPFRVSVALDLYQDVLILQCLHRRFQDPTQCTR